jgi:hypothetical protein
MEHCNAAAARRPNSGLIVTGSALAFVHRDLIVTPVAGYKLPGSISNAPSRVAVCSPTGLILWTSNLKTARTLGVEAPPTLLARGAGGPLL